MADRLNGKVAILFGAGSVGPEWGNEKATAVLFPRNGAHVACVDVNRETAQETVDIIPGKGGAATVFACDVMNSDAVKEVVDARRRPTRPHRRALQQPRLCHDGRAHRAG